MWFLIYHSWAKIISSH